MTDHPQDLPFGAEETDGSIVERLHRVAAVQPDAPALSGGDRTLSFAELVAAADLGGRRLSSLGLDRSRPVGILMQHEPTAIVAQLAVLAAGHVVLPLDHLAPAQELKSILDAADPQLVLVTAPVEELAVDAGAGDVLERWGDLTEGDDDASSGDLPVVRGSDPAYLLFTSGSTGEPKGAISLHGAFLRPAREVALHAVYGPGDRVALGAPLPFMAAVDTSLWAMLAGAELCLFSVRERGPAAFAAWMAAERITGWGTAVASMRAMAAALSEHPLPSLRLVMAGGDVIHVDDVPLVRAMSSTDLDIMPVYASTEIPLVAWQMIRRRDEVDPSVVLGLGDTVAGTTIELAEEGPDGRGEIVVSGPIGSLGYFRNPDLTAERFTFDASAGRMRFRTGDIGRRGPGGIEIVGRTDSMVKVRGYQVHLSMVEAAVRSHPGVTDAAVIALPDGDGDRVLVAHVSGELDGVPLESTSIRTLLRRNLPAHMVPARVIVHPALPMTSRGKVDRSALEARSGPQPRTAARPPRTATERALHAVWMELLGIEEIGVDEDFFEVGGDSVTAVQLLVHLEERYGLWQPLSTWMDATTIEAIAATIDAERDDRLRRLTRIQPGVDDRPPLVVAYDLHGGAYRFRRFAESVGTDQELWGLDNPMLDGDRNMPRSLAELAQLHVADLRRRFGDAPTHLVGYSGSGTFLVYEIVRQLLAGGHPVGFVCLVDFGPVHLRHGGRPRRYRPPGAWPDRAPSDLGLGDRIRYAVDRVRTAEPGERLERLSRVVDAPRLHDMTAARIDLVRRGRVRPELRTSAMWYTMMDALVSYRFEPVRASATLLVSDQTAKGNIAVSRRLDYQSLVDPMLGWDGLFLEGIRVGSVVGQHNDLMEEPYVGGVGRAVRAAFDEWLSTHGAPDRS